MKSTVALLGLALGALGVPAPVVVESLSQVPDSWEEIGSPPPEFAVKLSINLRSPDHQFDLFHQTLYEISDPYHENYGKHLSQEAAKNLISPTEESRFAVKNWLSEAGIAAYDVKDDGQWVHLHVAVDQAEDLLHTRFSIYGRGDERIVRTLSYSVPADVLEHVVTIQPTTLFAGPGNRRISHAERATRFRRSAVSDDEPDLETLVSRGVDCKTVVTPACIRKLYNMPEMVTAHPKSLFGLAGFDGQSPQFSELARFQKLFDPQAKGLNFSVALVNGGKNPQGHYPSGEANMNTQWSVSLAGAIPVRFYSVGGEEHDFNTDLDIPENKESFIEPYHEFASYLLNLPDKKLPSVVSVSYSVNEQHVPKKYAQTVCVMFGLLGTRGVSIVVSSGNLGPGSSCQSNDGKNTTKFMPAFPAACPYVTSVGGTEANLLPNPKTFEVAVNYSGGGFSDYFSRPKWQENALEAYLRKHGKEFREYFNQRGRGYPDVAALAEGHQVARYGKVDTFGGTSASSPTFGAIVALLNNERFKNGKPALGFLNPWIYQIASSGFTDITEGRTVGCEGESVAGLPSPYVPNAGWSTAKGWDPVTGFGTPLYNRLCKLATLR